MPRIPKRTATTALLVVCENPTTAVSFLRRLTSETGRVRGFPLLRAGVAAGPVVKRRADVFGATVNTAARLAAVAQPGQIIVSDEAASALSADDLAALTGLGPLALRNVAAPVDAFVLDIGTGHQQHVDPILSNARPDRRRSVDGHTAGHVVQVLFDGVPAAVRAPYRR